MADVGTGQEPTPQPQAGEGQQTAQEQPKTEQAASERTLEMAEARIKELNAEAAKYRKERDAEKKAREAADAATLVEQGKYKELWEQAQPKAAELDTLKERYETMIAQVQATNDKRIAAIPEGMKGLVPEYDDPLKVAAWLDANSAVFQKQPAPSLDAGAGSNGKIGATVTDEEVKEFAVRMGIHPDYVDRAAVAKAYKR